METKYTFEGRVIRYVRGFRKGHIIVAADGAWNNTAHEVTFRQYIKLILGGAYNKKVRFHGVRTEHPKFWMNKIVSWE